MLDTLRKRLQKDEEDGFTLIELMVVVLIIAILIAIAIPTFLGAQDRARDRGAQSDLRNGITAAKTIATDDEGQFTSVNATSLQAAEGALNFDTPAEDDFITVVDGGTDSHVLLWRQSASDTYYGVVARDTGAVEYCSGGAAGDVNDESTCTGDEW